MQKLVKFFVLSLILVASHSYAQYSDECIVSKNPKKRAECEKQHFEKHKKNKECIKKTPEILREADNLFKHKMYYKAYRSYDNANDFFPSSYAHLRGSEALFLAYATADHFEDDNAKSTGSCLLPSSFVEVVDNTLQTEYKVGVELAKIHRYGPPVTPAYLAEAEKRIGCLEAMAKQYRNAKTGCVDVAKIQACMGVKK